MTEATLIYPHQLFHTSPALHKTRLVYLIEEALILTHNPIHRAKLVFHKLSMDGYQEKLEKAGYTVTRLTIGKHPKTEDVFKRLRRDKVKCLHIADTTDTYLENAISDSGIERIWYDTPLFILGKEEAEIRFKKSKRFMASFYKQLRKDKGILIEGDNEPTGGKWSYDEDNRQKIPKGTPLPEDITFHQNKDIEDAIKWAKSIDAEAYGDAVSWLPTTHRAATTYLKNFLKTRFYDFGPYEDAMTTEGIRLWHSTLSPLINVGLLTPQQVLDEALAYATQNDIPLNSLEGFVRQIIGWREFIRASYEVDGSKMRSSNFWKHKRKLNNGFWTGDTGVLPVDHAIKTALSYGYNHHIERLMVMGNFMLLAQFHPDEVYRWFMGLYLDAYDWVMVPNVYGMSQFADGGSFATKPYISGANYIRKMSDFKRGEWEDIWTALYWNFINEHIEVFKNNHRLSMMPRTLARMKDDTRTKHFATAKKFLSKSA
ncbi:MAG: cryptochrome/photolyase family protein [Pseudomonadota bacterium]